MSRLGHLLRSHQTGVKPWHYRVHGGFLTNTCTARICGHSSAENPQYYLWYILLWYDEKDLCCQFPLLVDCNNLISALLAHLAEYDEKNEAEKGHQTSLVLQAIGPDLHRVRDYGKDYRDNKNSNYR